MRMRTAIAFLAGCAALSPAATAAAQQQPQQATRWYQPRMGVEFMTGSVEGSAAETQGTSTNARGLQFAMGVTAYRILDVSVDLGVMGLGDERSFSQETTEGEKESAVAAGIATFAVGLRTPPLRLGGPISVSGGVNVGHTFLDANRTIDRCIDCYSEDVSIGAGSFWEPGLLVFHNRTGLSARYRTYRDGSDLQDVLIVGVVVNTQRKPRAPEPDGAEPPAPPAAGR